MSNSWFQFKKFIVRQNHTAMKVGTDSVLLGAWCSVGKAKKILDVGTGTGIIALMAAQRSVAAIDAIEINPEAFKQAEENVQQSIFSKRIHVLLDDFIDFSESCDTQYDAIISNPPYFDNSLQPENKGRSVARHSETLGLGSLIKKSAGLLSECGRISLIIPLSKEVRARQIATESGLSACRSLYVSGNTDGPVKRILIEWTRTPEGPEIIENMNISENKEYSQAYVKLTRDFYLDL